MCLTALICYGSHDEVTWEDLFPHQRTTLRLLGAESWSVQEENKHESNGRVPPLDFYFQSNQHRLLSSIASHINENNLLKNKKIKKWNDSTGCTAYAI